MSYLRVMVQPARSARVICAGSAWHNPPEPVTHPTTRNFSVDSTVTSLWTTMSQSTPVAYVQQGLVNIHDFTGLPWWASVILSTVLMRSLVTLPLAIYQNKIVARLEKISLEMPEIVKGLKLETAYAIKKYNWTEQEARITYNRSVSGSFNC